MATTLSSPIRSSSILVQEQTELKNLARSNETRPLMKAIVSPAFRLWGVALANITVVKWNVGNLGVLKQIATHE